MRKETESHKGHYLCLFSAFSLPYDGMPIFFFFFCQFAFDEIFFGRERSVCAWEPDLSFEGRFLNCRGGREVLSLRRRRGEVIERLLIKTFLFCSGKSGVVCP